MQALGEGDHIVDGRDIELKKIDTFSERLLVEQPLQLITDEITGCK